jgi:hypothetical protein
MQPEEVLGFPQRGLFGLVAGLTEGAEVLTFEKVVTLLTSFYYSVV